MKPKNAAWILALGLLSLEPACAARFPDAVEKKIVLTGPATSSIADLFAMSSSQPTLSLRLGRNDAWAVYLLKKDTKQPLYNDNEGSPPRFDKLEFSSTPAPTLSISPFWLDLATSLPDRRPGYYSFSSPFIPEQLNQVDPWTHLVQRLKKEPQWKTSGELQFKRCFDFPDGKSLSIEVYPSDDWVTPRKGYLVIVTVHAKA